MGTPRKVVSAFSGGLDSTLILILLKEKYGYDEFVPVLVDVGQGEEEIEVVKERIDILRYDLISFDSKQEFAEE